MEFFLIGIFVIAYFFITIEHTINVNKAAPALLGAALCWAIFTHFNHDLAHVQLHKHTGEIAQILFFLLAAMTIVELIDAHEGFEVITQKIQIKDPKKLLWLIGIITFFLSAALDNLTTALVMTGMIKKMIDDKQTRLLFIGIIVIAANAGGAWSPLGDITTTMLWIGGQITGGSIMKALFIPSVISLLIPLVLVSLRLNKSLKLRPLSNNTSNINIKERNIIFWCGLGSLLAIPIFKTLFGLTPYLSILGGLSVLWIIIAILHKRKASEEKHQYSVAKAIQKIDTPSILFFLGILLIVGCLESANILKLMSVWLNNNIGNTNVISILIGLLSAIVDNVPIVAATIGMYDLNTFPQDHQFWGFIAYAAGTGGSCLIIGSAAGVAAMGMENISFMWYLKNISWIALIGYLCGAAVYVFFF